jgi:hypothetical protein
MVCGARLVFQYEVVLCQSGQYACYSWSDGPQVLVEVEVLMIGVDHSGLFHAE